MTEAHSQRIVESARRVNESIERGARVANEEVLKAHSQRAHAKLSPSAAHRWIECPGSIRMSEGIPNTSSSFADEGTAAHTLAEKCLARGDDPFIYEGMSVCLDNGKIDYPGASRIPLKYVEVTDDMIDAVRVYLNAVAPITSNPAVEWEIEAKLDLRHIPGMEFGTGDFCAYTPAMKLLEVVDYKHGRGTVVEVDDNPQLLAYAVGVARRYHNRGLDKISLTIVQPRAPHPSGPVRTKVYDAVHLLDFEAELTEAAEAALAPDAPLKPGDWCKFCPAAHKCEALRGRALEQAADAFAPESVDDHTPEQIASDLAAADLIKNWIKRVEEHAFREAVAGRPPPGWKLVEKRAQRKWADPDGAQALLSNCGFLEEQILVHELISPAQADKLLKKDKALIAPFVVAQSSGVALVHESDKRPAVTKIDAATAFSSED